MSNRKQILKNEYKERFSGKEKYRSEVWKVLCELYFSKYIKKDNIVLDLGSGYGEFSNAIKARRKIAIDLNPDGAKFLNQDVLFLNQDCSSPWRIEDASLDVVFSSNFLEHLPNKEQVEKTLKEAYKKLKPGGKIILIGPNIRFTEGEYWDFWDHFVPITDRSMVEVLKMSGFKINKVLPRFLPYTMSEGREIPVFFLKIYLKIPFVWKLLGKQFFIEAER